MCVRVKGASKQGIGIGTGALLLLLPQADAKQKSAEVKKARVACDVYDGDESRKSYRSQNEPLIRTEALQTVFFLFPDHHQDSSYM